MHERIAGRRMRVGAFGSDPPHELGRALLPPGSDLVVGAGADTTLVLEGWMGPPIVLIADGLLHLGPGMRINMCHDGGVDRLKGDDDELVARGIALPLAINVAGLNIRVREGLSVFVRYLTAEEPDWHPSQLGAAGPAPDAGSSR